MVEELVPAEQLFLRTTGNRLDRTMWGFLVRRCRFILHCQAISGDIRRRYLHVEHLLSQRRSTRTIAERAEAPVGFYLDSGWPGDNYEVTVAMALAMVSRGWRYGRDLLYLCFPHAAHDEKAWGMRLHLPMQLFTGVVARASRSGDPLLQNPPE